MKKAYVPTLMVATIMALSGCATGSRENKPERGPDGTVAYLIDVESSEPGARVEANNEFIGKTPCTIKVFGDKDGTFHNFGSYHYTITAYPVSSGQKPQTKDFRTGGWFTAEDRIPRKVFFDFGPPEEDQAKERN